MTHLNKNFVAFGFGSFAMLKTDFNHKILHERAFSLDLPAAAPPAVVMFRKCPLTALPM